MSFKLTYRCRGFGAYLAPVVDEIAQQNGAVRIRRKIKGKYVESLPPRRSAYPPTTCICIDAVFNKRSQAAAAAKQIKDATSEWPLLPAQWQRYRAEVMALK
jgi:hypothetical protein